MNKESPVERSGAKTGTQKRRTILKTLGSGAAVGLTGLAGCTGGGGGDGDGGSESTGTTTGSASSTAASDEMADSLVVQVPGGSYIDAYQSQVFDKFESEYGVTIESSLVSNQFDAYSKIKAGQSDTDLTITSASTLYNGASEDVWAEIDSDSISNYDNLLNTFQNPIYDPGEMLHAVPATYGTVGMAYNKDELGELDSWAAAWETANKGRVTMEGFGFVRVFTTALYLGMDPNDIQVDGSYEDGIQKIWDSVREQKDLVVKYWTSGDELVRLFSQETASVGEAWGGRIYSAVNDGYDHLDYVVPKEGAYGWSDNWVMVQGLSEQKRNAALAFLDFVLEDDVITGLAENIGYPPATGATSDKIEGLYDYDPSGGERLTFLNPSYKNEHNDQWSKTWEEIQKS